MSTLDATVRTDNAAQKPTPGASEAHISRQKFADEVGNLKGANRCYGPDDTVTIHLPIDQTSSTHADTKLSADDMKTAEDKLDSEISKVPSPEDQALLKRMNHDLLEGKDKEFGDALKELKGDPERIKSFVADMERGLKDCGAGVHLVVSKDGNVIAYKDGGTAGVQFNGKTGEASVVPLKWEGGNVIVEGGEVLNKTPNEVFGDIGQTAVRNILGTNFLDIPIHPYPRNFPGDHRPWNDGAPGWQTSPRPDDHLGNLYFRNEK